MSSLDLETASKMFLRALNLKDNSLNQLREMANNLSENVKVLMLDRFLSSEDLSLGIQMESLFLLLDRKTRRFSFQRTHINDSNAKMVIKLITKLSPNIEILNLLFYLEDSLFTEDFRILLVKCTKLKSLIVHAQILEKLLNIRDFNPSNPEVQSGLQKIEHIMILPTIDSHMCANYLYLIPNLKSFISYFKMGEALDIYIRTYDPRDRTLNITDINDAYTTEETMDVFAKYCPKAKSISLDFSNFGVVEKLKKFPLLTDLDLYGYYLQEVIDYLTQNGQKLRTLELGFPYDGEIIDRSIVLNLCPNLTRLEIEL